MPPSHEVAGATGAAEAEAPRGAKSGQGAGTLPQGELADSGLAEAILRNIGDGVVVVRASDGIILWSSPRLDEMHGYPPGELVGQPVTVGILDGEGQRADEVGRAIRGALFARGETRYELRMVRKDGTPFWARGRAVAFDLPGTGLVWVAVQRDVTERKEVERALRTQEAIVERVPVAITVMETVARDAADAEGLRLVWANPAAARAAALHPDSFLGKTVHDVLPEEIAAPLMAACSRALAEKASQKIPEIDFEGRVYRLLVVPVEERRIAVIAENVTRRAHAERELIAKAHALAQSNKALEHVVTAASHDLQEPLRMVTVYLQLLELRHGDRLDEEARGFLRTASGNAHRMRLLVKALLDHASAGAAEGTLEAIASGRIAPTSADAALDRALQELRPLLEETRAEVVREGLPWVLADASRLSTVFRTLVENAVKFRGREPPKVRVRAWREGRMRHFSVEDNGIGIEPAHAERIFGVFERLHPRAYPGTGVGLAICQRIVEGLGGAVWAESRGPGHGTTVHFLLPAAPPQRAWGPARPRAAEATGR